MAERPRTEEMTEPPSDVTTSKRMSSVANEDFDDILTKIAKALYRNSDINDLGKALGFGPADINRKIDENAKQGGNHMGTLDLLRMWRKGQTCSTEKAALRSALLEAGFDNLADQYLSTPVPGDGEAMPSEIMKLSEQLKTRYRKKFGQIKTSPVDSQSRTWLQHIYVSLVLMLGLEGEKEEPIDYDGLFKFIKTDTPKGFVTRLAFIGEAGVGKSTLFAKIALDWAEGKILQEIRLLFLESFREIKESGFFGDTVMAHFPDDSEIKGERVDAYVRKNPRKALILLDGLDEAHIDIKMPNCNDAIVSIVRGERFIDTPVVITTRPNGADQIKSIMTINDHYTFGKVKGFTKKNMSTYIKNYFKDDSQSASTLINFINTNKVVSEYMAPFPIFCCMLCCLWKTPSGRENIQTMETFSQLLKRLVFSLQEQYSSKRNESEEDYGSRMNKADESMKELGCIAFQGLLVKQLIFDEKALDSCIEAARTACEVGILSREKRPAPLQIRESQRKQFIQEFSFPHKLLQEYIASSYLASLFHKDRREFNRILADTLLEDYKEFKYVLYFTAAHGGEVGKSVLEALCMKVADMAFIIKVAFECHDSEAIDSVRNLLKTKADLSFTDHTIPALIFTLESIGKEVVRRSSSVRETLGVSKSFDTNASSSHVAAVGLFTLQNLQSLILSMGLDDEFFTGMSAAASHSKIKQLRHGLGELGPAASYHYARCLSFMPHLRSLSLISLKLSDDEFYSTMASEASNSKIQTLSMTDVSMMTPRRLHSILSLPHLQSLTLTDIERVDIDDGETLTRQTSSVVELSVEGKDVISLWNLGLHTSCPQVKKLELTYRDEENVSSGIITMACSPFHHLTHLQIEGDVYQSSTTLNDPVSFCDAVKTSCPLLTKLSFFYIPLNNEKAAEIIQLMKIHSHLTSIKLNLCDTNADLDPLISEVNSEGKVTVTVKHGDGGYLRPR
ncbi:NLR family CARD domain-containing protein 4-like isoform X2 [Strongylocentrotus purpuratus]|uniref:NACHT domain-containing protein n=1 Tax=Strongylocentrotus purpuratus TaxID=7668 RepID=A0A7M7NC92_STRPU|nr:NLR family CARD domain-containing protein 4-like isoform X2 [Strongylocentrotus purpuratus]